MNEETNSPPAHSQASKMMMDVDKFDEDDVWDDALFNIDDEPDSPAGVADFDVEKCELN